MGKYALEKYYILYLRNIKQLKESSIKHYLDAIKYISNHLISKGKIRESLYEIHDLEELEDIREYLKKDVEFVALDERGHRMYTAGLNNYCKFASGENFADICMNINPLDIEVTPESSTERIYQYWRRSSIVKMQSIEYAGHKCEIDTNHCTFTSRSNGKQYMEAHHAIPMMLQNKFKKNSLDVYANVICLCPTCHRLVHYGIDSERRSVVDKIYSLRSERLVKSGIKVSREEFFDLIK